MQGEWSRTWVKKGKVELACEVIENRISSIFEGTKQNSAQGIEKCSKENATQTSLVVGQQHFSEVLPNQDSKQSKRIGVGADGSRKMQDAVLKGLCSDIIAFGASSAMIAKLPDVQNGPSTTFGVSSRHIFAASSTVAELHGPCPSAGNVNDRLLAIRRRNLKGLATFSLGRATKLAAIAGRTAQLIRHPFLAFAS